MVLSAIIFHSISYPLLSSFFPQIGTQPNITTRTSKPNCHRIFLFSMSNIFLTEFSMLTCIVIAFKKKTSIVIADSFNLWICSETPMQDKNKNIITTKHFKSFTFHYKKICRWLLWCLHFLYITAFRFLSQPFIVHTFGHIFKKKTKNQNIK